MPVIGQADIMILLSYFIIILIVAVYFSKNHHHSVEDYFLAGRDLGWLVLGFSLFATNISTEHFSGLAGYGSVNGLAVGNIEWMAIIFLMLLGWLFAPLLLKEKILTVPEFFGKRYNVKIRFIVSGISVMLYILTKIAISLFAGGMILKEVFGLNIYISAIVILTITGLYTIVGGLRTVVYTAFLQAFLIILAGILLTAFGIHEIGGLSSFKTHLPAEFFKMIKPVSDPDFPWTGVILGAPILALWYWCADQYIVQKLLGARSIADARNGAILTGFLKLLPVFILVVPGLIAAVLFPGSRGDHAFSMLILSDLLPGGFKGIVLVGVISAMMSSLSSSFISASSLITLDFYKYFNPEASEKKLVLIGKLSTIFIVVLSILWIPLIRLMTTYLYVSLQQIQAYISPPIAAVFIFGIISGRVNSFGAIWSLIIGEFLGLLRLLGDVSGLQSLANGTILSHFFTVNFLHFAVFSFLVSTVVLFGLSYVRSELSLTELNKYSIPKMIHFMRNASPDLTLNATNQLQMGYMLSAILIGSLLIFWGVFVL
ncbi:MAG: sodium:solute symporter [Calditrichia bacterium]